MNRLRLLVLRWRIRRLAKRASKAIHLDAIDRIKTGRPYLLPFSDETFAELSRATNIPERFLRGGGSGEAEAIRSAFGDVGKPKAGS